MTQATARPDLAARPLAAAGPAARPGALVLADGRVFRGLGFGAATTVVGEVVFNTSMTGYQEIVTDPSYTGQLVCLTVSEVGNVGVNPDDEESRAHGCAGLVVRSLSPVVSNWRAQEDLGSYLARKGLPGLAEVDTRALTRHLRDRGAVMAALSSEHDDVEELLALARSAPSMEGQDLTGRVTTATPYAWDQPSWDRAAPPADVHVVAWDYGIKLSILRRLRDAGARVTVVPASTPASAVLAMRPDGILLSNGPGDPAAATAVIAELRSLLAAQGLPPVFGVCLGHQLLALALGGRTFKMKFGHHGGNHPVRNEDDKKVAITSQNHGFAVDPASLGAGAALTHLNLFDRTCAGLRVRGRPIGSVQYHPEAGPGPNDATDLLAGFVAQVRRLRRERAE
ncbi:carbamoyl-phosphate synthase small subunit [Nannocystis exedens]|uniref:Carbamoyl phosphate synthase small chain n=1 Tax=Nannocystis exedens TaxID=54 RepID=A0A1I1WIU0_9BACT|nr:glutamine-hydrolyzing carbamoyl-phosphate synthase small subunit [Nannocystis exedens]PCC67628.1 carbamoyl-phosphate synthase small chain [Nannocystis exedens]SFD93020.1 carbamoyl-phosphate synthase small subunit [Nannocystis exedens]